MSRGFRLFLLIVLGFGAVWIHRFRAPELELLLNPARPAFGNVDAPDRLTVDRAVGSLEPPIRTGWEDLASADWEGTATWSPAPEVAEEERESQAGAVTPELERLQYDPDLVLGVFEEDADGLLPSAFEAEGGASPLGGEGAPAESPPGSTRVETPPDPRIVEVDYVVQKDDNLWTVAKKFLGKGHRYREIMELNSLASEVIVPGTRLRLRVAENRLREENLKSTPPPDDKSVEASSGLREDSLSHKVKAGETLSQIASRYFPGDPEGVFVLFEANRERLSLTSPDEIREGRILVIPSRG